jgi:predicted CopG family antitoxin
MIGVLVMTTLARLLAKKQQLLERLNEGAGSHEREEIERLLMEIEDALNLLDEAGPGDEEVGQQAE